MFSLYTGQEVGGKGLSGLVFKCRAFNWNCNAMLVQETIRKRTEHHLLKVKKLLGFCLCLLHLNACMTELILFNKQTLILWESCFYNPGFLRVCNPIFIQFHLQNKSNFHILILFLKWRDKEKGKKEQKTWIHSTGKILGSLINIGERNQDTKRFFFSSFPWGLSKLRGDRKGNSVIGFLLCHKGLLYYFPCSY